MGVKFIFQTVRGANGFKDQEVTSDLIGDFEYKANDSHFPKAYKLYAPTRNDYWVSVEVVDRAVRQNCNIIVYDNWIFPTESGIEYANSKGILVFSVSEFIKKIKNNGDLKNE